MRHTLPKQWALSRIEELTLPEKGAIKIGPFGSALKKHEYSEAGIRVLGIEDVMPNRLTSDKPKFIPQAKYRQLSDYTVKAGDVLVTNMGTVGRACVVPPDLETSIISSHLIKVSLDKDRVYPPYVCWALNFAPSVVAQIVADSHGAIMAGFNSGLLRKLRIPLPPMTEQCRIVEVLDRAEALRAKRQAAIDHLDSLTQAIFFDMFGDPATNPRGWLTEMLGTVASQVTDGEHLTPKRTSEGIMLLSARNVRDGYIDITDVDYIGMDEFVRISRRCNPVRGDLLISCSGTVGRVACVETDEPLSLVRSVALVRPKPDILSNTFLEHYLRTSALKVRMLSRANASSQANLFQGQIRELPVLMPPMHLQEEFVSRVRVIGRLRFSCQASTRYLDALFSSLQHRAFRGEL